MKLSLATVAWALALPSMSEASECDADELTAFAYIYGYPVAQYANSVSRHLKNLTASPPNIGSVKRDFWSANDTEQVVRPNVDTLYITGFTDLSSDNVVFRFPEPRDDRFYSFMYMDPYGNNIAVLSSNLGSKPGNYVLRPEDGVANDNTETPDDFQGYIDSPTAYGMFVYRYFVKDKSNATDLALVHSMQDDSSRTPFHRTWPSSFSAAPSITSSLLKETLPSSPNPSSIPSVLTVLARIAPFNPPVSPSARSLISHLLSQAGLSPETRTYQPPPQVSLARASALVNQTLDSAARGTTPLSSNWTLAYPELAGHFGSHHYPARAYVAKTLYALLRDDVALYPSYGEQGLLQTNDGDGEGSESSSPSSAYMVTFSGKPPIQDDGFWSLTVYDAEGRLVPNGIDVSSLGSARTAQGGLRYADGELVYGEEDREDGAEGKKSFQILLQGADIWPPGNWSGNWLPTPPDGGAFTINLRFYAPTENLTSSAGYEYPVVTKIDAIV